MTSSRPVKSGININDLPNEIFFKIFEKLSFRQLDEVERVCKRWREISLKTVLPPWKNIQKFDIGDTEAMMTDDRKFQTVHAMAKRIGPNLRALNITFLNSHVLRNVFRRLAPLLPNLEVFNVFWECEQGWMYESDEAEEQKQRELLCIPECTPNLKALSIAYEKTLSTEILAPLLDGLPDLETFSLSIPYLYARGEGTIKLPPKLTKLGVQFTDEGCTWTLDTFLARAAADCPNICELCITDCDENVIDELEKFKNVQSLYIECPPIYDSIHWLAGMENLQHLSLGMGHPEWKSSLNAFYYDFPCSLGECTQLKILHIGQIALCPEETIWELTKLRQLRELDLNVNCRWHGRERVDLNAEEQQEIERVLATIAATAPLEHLFLRYVASPEFVINSLLRPCKTLRVLCLPLDVRMDEIYKMMEKFIAEENAGRELPIHILYSNNPEGNVIPNSPFIHWHHRHAEADTEWEFKEKMLQRFCPSHRSRIPESKTFLFDEDDMWWEKIVD